VNAAGRVSDYDPQSNKSVIFSAADGLLTVAYTGLSYLGDTPTDQWIAETLQGEPIPVGPDGERPWTFTTRWRRDWPSLGEAIRQVRDGLPNALASVRPEWRTIPITIVAAGWQLYRRAKARPVIQTIHKVDASGTTRVEAAPRHLGRDLYMSTEPDGHLSDEEFKQLISGMRNKGGKARLDDMVGAVRMVAGRSKMVGPHCMCTVLPPPHHGWAFVGYDSTVQAYGELEGGGSSVAIPVSFSPWVISRGSIVAPMVQAGSGTTEVGIVHCKLIIAPPKTDPHTGLAAYMGTQPRRPPPTSK
jgi:hypothetical protein